MTGCKRKGDVMETNSTLNTINYQRRSWKGIRLIAGTGKLSIPKRSRGRPSKAVAEKYLEIGRQFAMAMEKIYEVVGFPMSSRGWCYHLETFGINKDEFDDLQKFINDLRKEGIVSEDWIAENEKEGFHCGERWIDSDTPEEEAMYILGRVFEGHNNYYPLSIWEGQECFIQMLVEKIDLRTLFKPICEKYCIPIATAGGWSSIKQRKRMVQRFKENEEQDRKPVLLYCGDHDPAGLMISDYLRTNIEQLYGATGWWPTNLDIKRFGLNYDFIKEYGLPWIDNLITSSGRDLANPIHKGKRNKEHFKDYVQNYIKEFGIRKCEANALVIEPDAGRELCQETINEYLPHEMIIDHEKALEEEREKVADHVKELIGEGYLEEIGKGSDR